jgi:hypothetical protein
LLVFLEYFRDLGSAMVIGVLTGSSGALMRSFVLTDEPDENAARLSG